MRAYVEAAVARGERTFAVVGREVLPNILAPVLVDSGLRFTFSILIIASVNFLGLGLQPPSPDWALMISENREFSSVNVLGGAGTGGDDRPAHDRHQPHGRRHRTLARTLLRAEDRAERDRMSLAAPPRSVVRVDGLTLALRTGEPVVEDVSFSLGAGEILGLVGESGSGKTTTALALLGLHAPRSRVAQRHGRGRRRAGARA